MAYTAPRTFVTGEVETAAIFNTYLRDNDSWVLTDSPTCRAFNSVAQSINSATNTALTLDSERFDNASMHDLVTNNSRLTVPTGGAGKYLIGAAIEWNATAGGTYREIILKQNGATIMGDDSRPPTSTGICRQMPMTCYSFAAADYFQALVTQDTGAGLNITNTGNYSNEVFAFWFRT